MITARVATGAWVALVAALGPASATTFIFNLNSPTSDQAGNANGSLLSNLDLGTSATFASSPSGLTIIAYSEHTGSGTASDLYANAAGFDETGLGLTNDPSGEHELTPDNFIQIDFSQVQAKGITSAQFQFASVTHYFDQYTVYGSNTLHTLGTPLAGLSNQNSELETVIPGFTTYKYYSFADTHGNVLLANIQAYGFLPPENQNAVPEPGTFAVFALLLAGLGIGARRVRSRA